MTRQIVIVGGSFGGLGIAHYLLRKVLPLLHSSPEAYKILLLDASAYFWAKTSAPRSMVKEASVEDDKAFLPLKDTFKEYETSQAEYQQATVTGVDFEKHVVTVQKEGEEGTSEVGFFALILAPGAKTPTPLTSFQSSHEPTLSALRAQRARLASASPPKSIIISGGGPIAVESAGELASFLPPSSTTITLLTSSTKLLPRLSPALASKAEKILAKLGVKVEYGARVVSTEATTNSTTLVLEDGSTRTAELYIPATGTTPSTSFLPASVLDSRGYIRTTPELRVPLAADKVYALGDASNYSIGSIPLLYEAIPLLGHNIAHDLGVGAASKTLTADYTSTQLVPIGPGKGVGAFKGWSLPQIMVATVKGRDYFVADNRKVWDGSKWGKAVRAK